MSPMEQTMATVILLAAFIVVAGVWVIAASLIKATKPPRDSRL
jgi:hypothetical protein